MFRVGITDCDHVSLMEEEAVFQANDVEYDLFQCKTEKELIDNMKPYEVIALQYAPLTRRVMEQLPNLRCVVRYGVGVDSIDVKGAKEVGIAVCNVPDYGVQEVASHALALMFQLCRKTDVACREVKQGVWKYENHIPILRFSVMTVGVVGLGRIGRCFADMVHALGCRVLAYDPIYANKKDQLPVYAKFVDLDSLLQQSDVVSLHVPMEDARDLLGERELRLMKSSAYLINVSRGGIVNETALERALRENWICAAGFDVMAKEPPMPNHPLLHLDNFYCTPHMAWYSEQAAKDMKRKVAEEMVRALRDEPLHNQLNPF